MTAILLFDWDDFRQIKNLVSHRLRIWSEDGLGKRIETVRTTLRVEIVDFIHLLCRQQLPTGALVAGLSALSAVALFPDPVLSGPGRVRGGRS